MIMMLGSSYYRSHTFVSSGSFVVSEEASGFPGSIDYLVVAGGGAGGGYGGGGAGGLLSSHPDVPAPLRGTALNVSVLVHLQLLLVLEQADMVEHMEMME